MELPYYLLITIVYLITGGGPDRNIVVAFCNGKTATVPANTAVWIPSALHERVEFELHLPRSVRKECSEQAMYPQENLPGYPTSGPRNVPREFDIVTSRWMERPDHYALNPYYPYYAPQYPPVHYKYPDRPISVVTSEEVEDRIIPGTELTKTALNEKVMSQLMKYKMVLEDQKAECDRETAKLLRRRQNTESKSILKQSNNLKSVSFRNPDSDVEAEYDAGDLEVRDSGRGSSEAFSDGEYYSDSDMRRSRISGYDTDSDLYHCSRRSRHRSRSAGNYIILTNNNRAINFD